MLRSGHLFSFPSFHCSVVGVQVSLGSKILSARGSALPALQSLGLGATVPSPLMSGSVGWVLNLLRCHWKCSSASARSYISTHQPCCCPLVLLLSPWDLPICWLQLSVLHPATPLHFHTLPVMDSRLGKPVRLHLAVLQPCRHAEILPSLLRDGKLVHIRMRTQQ